MAMRKSELYDEDLYQWSREQAAALRRLSAERWSGPLDLEHLAEEVEESGSEVRNVARSQLRRLVEHARDEIAERLTATIRRDLGTQLPEAYAQALRRARKAVVRTGEAEAADNLPEECQYPLEGLLDETWSLSSWRSVTR